MLSTLILSNDDIAEIVREVGVDALMDALIERLRLAFGDGHEHCYSIPARSGFHYDSPAPGLIEWMPLWQRGRRVMMKMVAYHPRNPSEKGIPTVLSTTSIFDTATGHLEAMMDGTLATALRTGAASAVASRLLARPDSKVLGLIGCGAQAVTQLHALSHVFELEEVVVFDVDDAALQSLQHRCSPLDRSVLSIRACSAESVVEQSDILCTATSVGIGCGPVFENFTATRPWLHINAVGSDLPDKTEIPIDLLRRATVCPDFLEQAEREGECQQLSADQIGPSIVEVAQKPQAYAELQQGLTVFDSTGFALEDLTVMELFLEYAAELKLGTAMGIEGLSRDPRNPYASLGEMSGVPGATATDAG